MLNRWNVAALAVLALGSTGSGRRDEMPLVSFHLETTKEHWPKFAQAIKMGNPARQYYFQLMPSLTDKQIAWYYPFLAADGQTFGVAFKLSRSGTERLTALTSMPNNHGRLLASNVQPVTKKSGPARSFVRIDRRVTDGVLVIWQGLTNQHLQAFSQRFAHVKDLAEATSG